MCGARQLEPSIGPETQVPVRLMFAIFIISTSQNEPLVNEVHYEQGAKSTNFSEMCFRRYSDNH